jgi:hypothetical protein
MSYSISTRFTLRKSRTRWAKGLRYEAIRTSGVCSSSSILIVKQKSDGLSRNDRVRTAASRSACLRRQRGFGHRGDRQEIGRPSLVNRLNRHARKASRSVSGPEWIDTAVVAVTGHLADAAGSSRRRLLLHGVLFPGLWFGEVSVMPPIPALLFLLALMLC